MADNKQYITHVKDGGVIQISEDVISSIALHSLTEIEGYAGTSVKPGADIVELIGKKNWGKGVKVQIVDENQISIDCNVIIYYGHSVVTVASAVQEAVLNAVRSAVGVSNVNVNVNVCGIVRQ